MRRPAGFFEHLLAREAESIDGVLLVTRPELLTEIRAKAELVLGDRLIDVIPGGESRQESVGFGLSYLAREVQADPESRVLIHDGARPLISASYIDKLSQLLRQRETAVALARPVTDTLRRLTPFVERETTVIPREDCVLMQTPQGAPLGILLAASQQASAAGREYTDDIALLEACGYPFAMVIGPRDNLKITEREDLDLALFYLQMRGEA